MKFANKVMCVFSTACILVHSTGLLAFTVYSQKPTEEDRTIAKNLQERQGNGIHVDFVKVYDDGALQLLLNSAKARLATLQAIEQGPLSSGIGVLSGANLQQQGFSAQIMGPSIPGQTVTTSSGQTVPGTSTSSTTTVESQTQLNPTAPSVPSFGTSLPTGGLGVSSLDRLNEMMQLTYEIANLQMLLDGSLSDRYVQVDKKFELPAPMKPVTIKGNFPKPRTTLGFSISVSPGARYKDAVAVVDVEVTSPTEGTIDPDAPPSIVSLLPREKTYNVAAITDKMTSISGGVVTNVISGGGGFLRSRKTYYVVQDQDTLALNLSSKGKKASFSWQFRPVLGQSFVRAGLRQSFVQIAMPIYLPQAKSYGDVKVTTYWQRYDRKKGVLKDVIPGSHKVYDPQRIPIYPDSTSPTSVKVRDLGNGFIHTRVEGQFTAGTAVRIGGSVFGTGSPGFSQNLNSLSFVASAPDVAKHGAFLVNRSGTETQIKVPLESTSNDRGIKASVNTFDSSRSVLRLEISLGEDDPKGELYNVIVGNRLFGLQDSPIMRSGDDRTRVFEVIVPNNVLFEADSIKIKPFLYDDSFTFTSGPVSHFTNVVERIFELGSIGNDKKRYLIYGNRLGSASVVYPENVSLGSFQGADVNSLRTFDLSNDDAKSLKNIVLVKGEKELPVFVPMPASTATKPSVSVSNSRLMIGSDTLRITSDSFDKLKTIKFGGATIFEGPLAGKKELTLTGLSKSGVTSAVGNVKLDFDFGESGKTTLDLDIVSGRIELVLPNF